MCQIYYVVEQDFSKGNAITNRVLNNVKAITNKDDCKVTIIGYGDVSEIIQDGYIIKNVKRGNGLIQKLFFYVLRGFFVIQLLRKESPQPQAVVFFGFSPRFLVPLLSYVRSNKIKIIIDIVEWFKPSHLPLGRFGPFALDLYFGMKYFIPKCDGVIAISTFLQNYYASRNLKTIRIPVLVDTTKNDDSQLFNIEPFDKKYLNLIYAGFPGEKDLIFNLICAVEKLYSDGVDIRLHLLGPTRDELERKSKRRFAAAIVCHGKVLQNVVPGYLKQADFSILIRPDERYAHAGFPTKFVESLNAGLPVIANYTSDLSLYLKDGYNGFVLEDSSIIAITETLKTILAIDKSKLKIMHKNANLTAKSNFDFRLYANDISLFIHQIIDR